MYFAPSTLQSKKRKTQRDTAAFAHILIVMSIVIQSGKAIVRAAEHSTISTLESSTILVSGRRSRGGIITTFVPTSSGYRSTLNRCSVHQLNTRCHHPLPHVTVRYDRPYSSTTRYWSPDDQYHEKNPPRPKQHRKDTSPNKLFNESERKPTRRNQIRQHDISNESVQEIESQIAKVTSTNDFFAPEDDFPTFQSIGVQSPVLLQRIERIISSTQDDVMVRPSAVQAGSFRTIQSGVDVKIGAETGSGKTMAYLLPIIDDILQRKKKASAEGHDSLNYDYARAIVLVPNKELANQVVRMAVQLCGPRSLIWGSGGEIFDDDDSSSTVDDSDIVRLGILPGGLKSPDDYRPFRMGVMDPTNHPPLDIVITTPASLGPIALSPKNVDLFADVQTLVIDEADMLFDGGYLRQLENVLMGFRRADRLDPSFDVAKTQHVLVAATLPDMGLKSVDAYIQKKFPYATSVTMSGMHNARHYGLKEKTTWIEDDQEELQVNKKRLERLVAMFQKDSIHDDIHNFDDSVGVALAGEKVMIFLNSVDDVDGATNALRRNGVEAVPFHAKIPLAERTSNLDRFRRFVSGSQSSENQPSNDESSVVPVLVCTDLAARGLDIPGVSAVVQLQFAGNVVTHLHRMGRCGRAGNRDGRGVIFYGGKESALVEVVREAEFQQDRMVLKGNDIDFEEEGVGKVQDAFSRKRGFTRKRKKLKKKMLMDE